MRYFLHISATITFILLGIMTNTAIAWDIVTHTDTDNNSNMRVAHTKNNEGYSLEIYQDANRAVRSRFSMNNSPIVTI